MYIVNNDIVFKLNLATIQVHIFNQNYSAKLFLFSVITYRYLIMPELHYKRFFHRTVEIIKSKRL